MPKKAKKKVYYTRETAPKCRVCGKTSADWHEAEDGKRWAVRLTRNAAGRLVCTWCEDRA